MLIWDFGNARVTLQVWLHLSGHNWRLLLTLWSVHCPELTSCVFVCHSGFKCTTNSYVWAKFSRNQTVFNVDISQRQRLVHLIVADIKVGQNDWWVYLRLWSSLTHTVCWSAVCEGVQVDAGDVFYHTVVFMRFSLYCFSEVWYESDFYIENCTPFCWFSHL